MLVKLPRGAADGFMRSIRPMVRQVEEKWIPAEFVSRSHLMIKIDGKDMRINSDNIQGYINDQRTSLVWCNACLHIQSVSIEKCEKCNSDNMRPMSRNEKSMKNIISAAVSKVYCV